ncbi:MAG TPA: transposase, partial [Bacillota bacterium]|nr:transposase [Bacillota bacterium]
MLERSGNRRTQVQMVDVDMLVPEDHLLRKIDQVIDFDRIYEFVGQYYCQDNGRPAVDPVVLFKMVLIQHLFGIPSLRRTVEEITVNVAYAIVNINLIHWPSKSDPLG